ncbi:MAG: hypothetical protein V4550_03885 [Gemmatimonadota bacterium]
MPSRADARRSAEWVLRGALIAALAWALWLSIRRAESSPHPRRATPATLAEELQYALTTNDSVSIDFSIDATPTRADRDLLVALRRAGIPVSWSGSQPPLAMQLVREREPAAGAILRIAGDGAAAVAIVDSAGPLDSVVAQRGATLAMGTLVGAVRAKSGDFYSRTRVPDAATRRPVLVLGRAGWETKFVMTALTESGWNVRSRIPTAPNVFVHDDGLLPLDTARYDAVIALDSTAADMTEAIARFVQQGGGLVLTTNSVDALKSLAPGNAGDRRPGRILLAEDTVTSRDLPIRPVASLRTDAIALERQSAGVALAARRAGLGRVLAVGYDESWRWRMLGGSSGLAAHRAWWSRAVGSVVAERLEDARPAGDEAAPRAALFSALGPPRASGPIEAPSPVRIGLSIFLLLTITIALLAETASRRFRGAK